MTRPLTSLADDRWMDHALALATRGLRHVEPNPPVGAVVVAGDARVSEGWHAHYGGPHAEVAALRAAGEAARGATVYVTLEPCAHTGKTPPCTEALIAAGVARVVYGVADPDPNVAGRSRPALEAAGIAVRGGVREAAGRALLAPYLTHRQLGRPYTILKWAASLDGKIATATGESQWISGPGARRWVHRLRAACDVVAVGAGTARRDDPRLTARDVPLVRAPARLVVASRADLAADAQLLRTAREQPTWVAHVDGAPTASLSACGCTLIGGPAGPAGRVDLPWLWGQLGSRGAQSVLVEGGGELGAALLAAGLVDAVLAFVAPRLIGGRDAPGPLGGAGADRLGEAPELPLRAVERVGADLALLCSRAPAWSVLAGLFGVASADGAPAR